MPVLVMGEGTGALAAARSLARHGVTVYCLHQRPRSASLASRYWKRKFRTSGRDGAFESHIEAVRQAADAIGTRVVLIPTGDRETIVASEVGAADQRVIVPRMSPAAVRSLIAKPHMLALAVGHGLSTPRTIQVVSSEDIERSADVLTFPVIVKRADPARHLKQNVVFQGPEQLRAWGRGVSAEDYPSIVIQDWIPGADTDSWMFNGYFDERSQCLAAFTARKIRQFPRLAGASSIALCCRNDEIHRQSVEFLEALHYQGPVDIDYRYDSRDGRYKILDVNPRIGAAFRLGVTAGGLDIVRVFYHHITGQPTAAFAPVEPRKWMVEEDLLTAIQYRRAGELGLRDWLASLRGVRETAYFALDDPLPFVVWAGSMLRRVATAAVRRGARRRVPGGAPA